MDEGWSRFIFENYEFPVTSILTLMWAGAPCEV
jgi:hypothetical protein